MIAPSPDPNRSADLSWAGRFKAAILGCGGRRRWMAAFAAGAASVLSMAPFHVWPVLFLTLPVLVWLIDAADRRSAFAAGWWFGFGYFLFGLFWIGEAFLVEAEKYALLLPFAVTLLPAGLAFFFAAAAWASRAWWPETAARIFILAVALAMAEWLRGHVLTGLPWNTLGYALTYPLPLMQSASVIGTYSLTLWVVVITALPLVVLTDDNSSEDHPWPPLWRAVTVALVPLAVMLAYGLIKLSREPLSMVDGVRLRLVQPSVPQREKWRPENQGSIFRDHLDLSRRNASGVDDGMAGITHVVWPEAAMPFFPLEHPEALAAIAETFPTGTRLLTGALRFAGPAPAATGNAAQGPRRQVHNSLIVFDDAGAPATIYDKTHLVPFGEYLPLPALWRMFGLRGLVEMRGAFAAGPEPRPLLDVAGLPKVGALICYEAIFPGDAVQGKDRPGLLLSVTNDGWFGNTTGPRQHFHQARVRAVEEGLPLIRVANNGISAVIDAEGRVLHRLGMNERGVIDTSLPVARAPTTYARLGDQMFAMQIIGFLGFTIAGGARRRRP
ncbi:MAG: apolipoprotein N-acyltransferase [Hyphomicrobium sp.]